MSRPEVSIVKIGGDIIENEKDLVKFLYSFSEMDAPKILVHGGGKKASEVMTKMGIIPKMIGGRRITDAESLKVITMVYGGLTNKNIVARLQALNCNAIGLSGADGNAIGAHKRPVGEIDYGFAGDVDYVNYTSIKKLLDADFVPVFCALTHDGNGRLLNTNADTIASEIAIGMSNLYKTSLYYCFEKKGVLKDVSDENSVIQHIDSKSFRELLKQRVIADGMLPKLENCFHALNRQVGKVYIGNIEMLLPHSQLYTTVTL